MSNILEDLSDEEAYLWAILSDESGLDQAEFFWYNAEEDDGCFRAWNYQWKWWRSIDHLQIDQSARSVGKSLSIKVRSFAFPFIHPGQEMLITAPEGVHLSAITGLIENQFKATRIGQELLPKRSTMGVTHRPFEINFMNGARIMGRIPQRTGVGVKGSLAAGSLILTQERGFVEVENIRIGEHVWSHFQRWTEVLDLYSLEQEGYLVRSGGAFPMTVSLDHRFYAKNDVSSQPGKMKRELGAETWEWPDNFTMSKYNGINVYAAAPNQFDTDEVELPDFSTSLTKLPINEDFWWLVGRTLADGCTSPCGHVSLCVHPIAHDDVLPHLEQLGITYRIEKRPHSSADKINFNNAGFAKWFRYFFGTHSHNKTLPSWVFGMDARWRSSLLNGYVSGTRQSPRIAAGSASKKLALGMGLLGHTLGYGVSYTTSKINVKSINGVEPKQPLKDSHRFFLTEAGSSRGIREDGFTYYKVKSVEPAERQTFYGIVTGDHSYYAEGLIHHNSHPIWLEMDECFPAGSMVLTNEGMKPIELVGVGDKVLTHTGRYSRVTNTFDRGVRSAVTVVGQGHPGLVCTPNHKFYAQKAKRWKKGGGGFEWLPAQSMSGSYWSSPSIFPELPVPPVPLAATNKKRSVDILSDGFLELLGWYIAEGSTSSNNGRVARATWSVTPTESSIIVGLLYGLGLHSVVNPATSSDECVNVVCNHSTLARWLAEQTGTGAKNKKIPAWVFGLPEGKRVLVLRGLISGDGFYDPDQRYASGRWKVTTVSRALAYSTRLLGQSCGWHTSVYWNDTRDRESLIRGRVVSSDGFYQVVGNRNGQGFFEDGLQLTKVRGVKSADPQRMYDLEVEDDHSFVVDGVVVHNSQDYPDAGWTEIIETLKRGAPGAVWRCHGVTRGMRDYFYKFTQPDSGWTVHRFCAMSRPNWSDEERQEKIEAYGSRNHPDYKRNVLGQHGDATNPLFVLHRLLNCVDQNLESDYNNEVYQYIRINDEMVEDYGGDILSVLDLPRSHVSYKKTWIGMDVGFMAHPSEILVFSEENKKTKDSETSVLRLITRLHLERISHGGQVAAILWLLDFYKPLAFSLDKMQPLSEPVLTPDGWVELGNLSVGDLVIGSDGKPTKVVGYYPQKDKRVRSVHFSDGSSTRCGPEHLWTGTARRDKKILKSTFTTDQLLELKKNGYSVKIPMISSPVEFNTTESLPVAPYLLGALLGDGNLRKHSIRFSNVDVEILDRITALLPVGYELAWTDRCNYILRMVSERQRNSAGQYVEDNEVLNSLRELGISNTLSHCKSIPKNYMRASISDRIELLRGLMDTDGHVDLNKWGYSVGFRSSSKKLVDDVRELVQSLGGTATYTCQKIVIEDREYKDQYRTNISLPNQINPFHLTRKRDRVVGRNNLPSRYVRFIDVEQEEESACIRVEAEDHLYVTKDYILTHNTGIGLPLFQDIQERAAADPRINDLSGRIKGYNFSSKILVDFDHSKEFDEFKDDAIKTAGIEKNVLEHASDRLRDLVDNKRLILPWDKELLSEFQGQTWTFDKSKIDMYGRKKTFSRGSFHALDAARMAVLAWSQYIIEEMTKNMGKDHFVPTPTVFL